MAMTFDHLTAAAADGSIDTVVVAFTDPYGRLMGKRFDAAFFCESVGDGTHACDYLFTVDVEMEPCPATRSRAGISATATCIWCPTSTRCGWRGGPIARALVLCDVHDNETHELVPVAPRTILRASGRAARRTRLPGTGGERARVLPVRRLVPRGTCQGLRRPAGGQLVHRGLPPALRRPGRALRSPRHAAPVGVGITVENSKGEWGRGQHELNIRYDDVLAMADAHAVMKHGMKELAGQMG